MRACENCRTPFQPWRRDQRFCQKDCGTRWHKRIEQERKKRLRQAVPRPATRRCPKCSATRPYEVKNCGPCAVERVRRRRERVGADPTRPRTVAQKHAHASREARRRAAKRHPGAEAVDRLTVYKIDQGVCGLCGRDADVEDFELDHIVPLACGGAHTYANVQVAHGPCNRAKGGRLS